MKKMVKAGRKKKNKGLVINSNSSSYLSRRIKKEKPARTRQKYIDYDYESAFTQSLEDWDEYLIQRLLLDGKAKGIYATKEIYSGDQLEIEIYPEFTRKQSKAMGIQPIDKKKQQEMQKKLNGKNSRKKFWRLCEHNFHNGDFWITLTYAREPSGMDEALENMQKFIRNVNGKRRRRGIPNAKYLYVTEEVSEDGEVVRIHHHLFMDSLLDLETVMKTWKHGGRNECRRIEKDEDGIRGAAFYTAKEKADTRRRKYKKRWSGSKNLERPPEKKHHQTKEKDVRRMVRDRDYIEQYVNNARLRSGKRRYDGYTYSHSSVYFNDYNAQFYIQIRMRRTQPEKEGCG